MDIITEKYWKRIQEGDERAFEIVFKEVYPALFSYASHMLHDNFLADEIVLDVFTRIWESRQEIVIKTSFKAYLIRCVRNKALDAIKKNRGKKSSFESPVTEEMWKFIMDTVESDDSLLELMMTSETETYIARLIASLSPQCRRVFEKSRIENKPIDLIATELNLTKSTVRSHISHAISRISSFFHVQVKKN